MNSEKKYNLPLKYFIIRDELGIRPASDCIHVTLVAAAAESVSRTLTAGLKGSSFAIPTVTVIYQQEH